MMRTSGLPLIYQMVKKVFPQVRSSLREWRRQAALIPDGALRSHAISSIDAKTFHCLGGCVFSLHPAAMTGETVRFIVAFQTISDYLDNLCDRAGLADEQAFRQLHLAMADAVDPDAPLHSYYDFYPNKNDGGYLGSLVACCRREMARLSSFGAVQDRMKRLVSLYSELQVLKHGPAGTREDRLRIWAAPLSAQYPLISVWEFCSAAGSTLGVFLLFATAQHPRFAARDADTLLDAYFPWVCGLHILLDYFIDSEEDRREGDFNFTSYYRDAGECAGRLSYFISQSLPKCSALAYSGFHETVVRGLLAMYLSDKKAETGMNMRIAKALVRHGGSKAVLYLNLCRAMRLLGKL